MGTALRTVFALLIFCGLGFAEITHCRTLTVAQDGSGDYSIIQDAVDAAEDGDTIVVGPGHYTEYTELPEWNVYVWLDGTKSLTLFGAGSDQTHIGPTEYVENYRDVGIYCDTGDVEIVVHDIRILNQNHYGVVFGNTNVELLRCVVENSYVGGLFIGDIESVHIADCQFIDGPNLAASSALTIRAPHVVMQNSLVRSYKSGVNLDYPGATDVLVTNCRFDADPVADNFGLVGLQFTLNGGGTVENCYFTGWRNYGFVVGDAGSVVFQNNVVENCRGAGIGFEGCHDLTVQNNIIAYCSPCVFIGQANGQDLVRNNHFIRDSVGGVGSGLFIGTPTYFPYGPFEFDFLQNYWGVTDPEFISTYIVDGYDNEDVWLFVNFLPLAEDPVRTESRSWSEVKSLFRVDDE